MTRSDRHLNEMKGSADIYYIRIASEDEIDRLRDIEDKAGEMFLGLGLIDDSLDDGVPTQKLEWLIETGQVWVACTGADQPVGFVIVSKMDGAVYIEEMDVLPVHGRRGLGTRLLEHACEWAKQHGHFAVTLSTFRDVPWNAPFYRKHGFKNLAQDEWTSGMCAIRKMESEQGLNVEARVFMKRDLSETESRD